MSVCVAMSQGYIGYDLQNAIREELLNRNINKGVSTIITQVEVDSKDSAFDNPTKPIGAFMTKEEADSIIKEGKKVIEDSGRGYRRVVASPKPIGIVEVETIKALVESGQVVIACGGGGIPVVSEGNHLKGVGAVIDKDYATTKEMREYVSQGHFAPGSMKPKVEAAIEFAESKEGRYSLITLLEKAKYGIEGKTGTKIYK